jgi:GcrA cell cycle regulator
MPPAFTPWSDDKVEELRRLWAAGFSASEIAERLDIDVTRCGIIGKVHRLGLTPRKSAEFKPGPPPERRGPIVRRPVFIAPRVRKEKPVLDVSKPTEPKPRMRRLQFMQLKTTHCKWPFGDPHGHPFYFCGADKDGGVPYCPHHMVKAFVKPRRG